MAKPIEHFPELSKEPLLYCSCCNGEIYSDDDCLEYQSCVFCSLECLYESVKEEAVAKKAKEVEEGSWM